MSVPAAVFSATLRVAVAPSPNTGTALVVVPPGQTCAAVRRQTGTIIASTGSVVS